MESQRSTQRTALVTGASSGIGLELARLLAADGVDLVLVGRNGARLDEVARDLEAKHPVRVRWEAIDLSAPHASGELWAKLERAGIAIDILINNAGSGLYGNLDEQNVEDLQAMLQVNIVALTTLTRLALPGMKARRWGRILNMGSLVGYQAAGPRMAGYYASKAYVVSFSKGLARELTGSGVSVTVVSPGLTESSFEERSGASRAWMYQVLPKMSAAAVARAGYAAMKRQATAAIPGLLTKLLAIAGELPPRRVGVEVNRFLLREAKPASRARNHHRSGERS